MDNKLVYLVVSCFGGCDNPYFEQVERVFSEEEKAKEFASKKEKDYVCDAVFPEDVWNDICLYADAHIDDEDYVNPYIGGTDEWVKWNNDFEEYENNIYLEAARKAGFNYVTMDDIKKQFKSEQRKIDEYRETKVTPYILY